MSEYSPFSSVYPRLNNSHAVQALKKLDNFLILDTETTGVGKDAEVCELAIVNYKDGQVLFNSLLRPYNLDGYDNSKARTMTGITMRQLLNAPTLPDVWEEVVNILQWNHITAFNADFDLRMIRNSAWKWGLQAPTLYATCLMKIATAFLNLDYWVSLEEAARIFDAAPEIAHRALGDALTTRNVVIKMKEMSSNGK